MYIEELKEEDETKSKVLSDSGANKRVLVGVGARFLFYPTLLYNVVRNTVEPAFHWWDKVDEFLLLGAVPFPSDVPHLKRLDVHGVVTLNEPYETLVPVSLYLAHGIQNLVIPTRDYLFAPSFGDIRRAVDFIHENASCGKTTYVHCKAGRGRSTTIVLCYLIQHKQMTPASAYKYVKLRRPRILLAAAQWQAVQDYYSLLVKKEGGSPCLSAPSTKIPALVAVRNLITFDESSFVLISKADLNGYDVDQTSAAGNDVWVEFSVVYRVQFVGQIALARLSRFWYSSNSGPTNAVGKNLGREPCSVEAAKLDSGHPCLQSGMTVRL